MNQYVLIHEENKIIIQDSSYIEDGWCIEVIDNIINLYEIPMFGGEPILIKSNCASILEAIELGNSLT